MFLQPTMPINDICFTPFVWHNQVLQKLIERRREEIRKTRPGLTCFKDGVRQIPIESIPGVLEAGWKPDDDT